MLGVNRIGFTELLDSEVTGDHSQRIKKVKYGRLMEFQEMLILIQSSIILVHGLRGHPFETWASSQQTGNERAVGPSIRRQHIKSFFKSKTPPSGSISTHESIGSQQQQIFWPRDYLIEDVPQARVWTYGYNADVISGLFQANNKNSVSGHGRDLKVRLEREIDNEVTPSV